MRHLFIIIICFALSYLSAFSQTSHPVAIVLRCKNVTEFVFDNIKQEYKETAVVEFTGTIIIDSSNIFIEGYNSKAPKTFEIINTGKRDDKGESLYYCEISKEKYTISISVDKKYLTLIGKNEKHRYELDAEHVIELQNDLFKIDKEIYDKEIYEVHSLEDKPLFANAVNFDESELLLNQYIKNECDKIMLHESGTCYISIMINKKGKVEDVKLIYGNNKALNNAALKIAGNMPDWKPAKIKNNAVNSSYNIEVKY